MGASWRPSWRPSWRGSIDGQTGPVTAIASSAAGRWRRLVTRPVRPSRGPSQGAVAHRPGHAVRRMSNGPRRVGVEGHDTVAPRNALRNALRNTIRDTRVTRSTTPDGAETQTGPKPDSLRSTRAGAIGTALPSRDQQLLLWLLAGDIVTAQLASVNVFEPRRTTQYRLERPPPAPRRTSPRAVSCTYRGQCGIGGTQSRTHRPFHPGDPRP